MSTLVSNLLITPVFTWRIPFLLFIRNRTDIILKRSVSNKNQQKFFTTPLSPPRLFPKCPLRNKCPNIQPALCFQCRMFYSTSHTSVLSTTCFFHSLYNSPLFPNLNLQPIILRLSTLTFAVLLSQTLYQTVTSLSFIETAEIDSTVWSCFKSKECRYFISLNRAIFFHFYLFILNNPNMYVLPPQKDKAFCNIGLTDPR